MTVDYLGFANSTPTADPIGSFQKGFGLSQEVQNTPVKRQQLQQDLANSQQSNQNMQTTNQTNQFALAGAKMKALQDAAVNLTPDNYLIQKNLLESHGIVQPGVMPDSFDPQWQAATVNKLGQATQQLALQEKQADVALKQAHAKFFANGGATGQGGATGALMKQLMAANPDLTPSDALAYIKGGANQGIQYEGGTATPVQGYGAAKGANAYDAEKGKQNAQVDTAQAKAAQQTIGKTQGGYAEQALGMKDMVDLYKKIQDDAKTTPSGFLESSAARLANSAGVTTEDTKAQAAFDADLNNLYLGTIRSMKGTGRIMEAELQKIAEAAPKPTDSNSTKIIKAQQHMDFYKKRMKEIGFDPDTGQKTGAPTPQPVVLGGNAQSQPDAAPRSNATVDYKEYFK